VDVHNAETATGDETTEGLSHSKEYVGAPLRALVGFDKVASGPRRPTTIQLKINPRQLSIVSPTCDRSVRRGGYELYIEAAASNSGVFLPFRIQGTKPHSTLVSH